MQRSAHDFEIPIGDVGPLMGEAARLGAPAPAPGGVIHLADYFRLLRSLSQALGEETFALSARPMVQGTAEFVITSAAGGATLGEAMVRIARAYNLLHGAEYNRVERHGPTLTYLIADEGYPYTRPRDGYLHLSLECALIFLHAALCELAQADLSPHVRRVATRRVAGEGAGGQALAFWEAPVHAGGAAYAVTYDAGVAALPVRRPAGAAGADLAVHNRITALIEARFAPDAAGGDVEAAVRRLLDDGVREQEGVARRLGLSTATLRRRLSEAGASFRDLRHEVMNAYACRRLAQQAEVRAVAEELGFSDPRAFTRAFKAWNGATPTGWRRDV